MKKLILFLFLVTSITTMSQRGDKWEKVFNLQDTFSLLQSSYEDGPSQTGYICEKPWNNNEKKVIDRWHWEPCGDVCCEKTYEICKEYSPVAAGMVLKINNINRHKLPGSECSKQGEFFKWDTMTPIPCEDGCQGDGN